MVPPFYYFFFGSFASVYVVSGAAVSLPPGRSRIRGFVEQ